MPILKEIVELLFSKGYIKLLFCSETFSMGLNMPIKTVIFTDLYKFDGSQFRILQGHEYNQAGGRAGRRGLDTVGHVIHLTNLFKKVELTEYKNMMRGEPQKLISKFMISYNLLLNLIDSGVQDFVEFAKKSMIQNEIEYDLQGQNKQIEEKEKQITVMNGSISILRTKLETVQHFIEIKKAIPLSVNKKRKELEREIEFLKDDNKFIDSDVKTVEKYNEYVKELELMKQSKSSTEDYLQTNIEFVLELLEKEDFIEKSDIYTLKSSGFLAANIREVHCLVFAKLIEKGDLDLLDVKQLIGLLSCFTNVVVQEEKRSISSSIMYHSENLKNVLGKVASLYDYYEEYESKKQLATGVNYDIHYDLIDAVIEWSNSESVEQCKRVLQKLEKEKEIFLGDFVKAILKINNISSELEKVAESIGNMNFLEKLKEIPCLTQKYVVISQSLYV
jgi:superfamily II RNA helicase